MKKGFFDKADDEICVQQREGQGRRLKLSKAATRGSERPGDAAVSMLRKD